MQSFSSWTIRSKLAFIAIVPVLLSVALLCLSFMTGYLDLKNNALPSQKTALMIADRSYSYLSYLRKYAAQPNRETLNTLNQADRALQQYVSRYQEIIGTQTDGELQRSRQIINDVGEMLDAGRKVILLSDTKEAVIENTEESEQALISLLSNLTSKTNRNAERILAANDTHRLETETLPNLNTIADLSALGHSLLSEIREFMLQPNETTRHEMIEMELGLRQASQRFSNLASSQSGEALGSAADINSITENLIGHAEMVVEQHTTTVALLEYLAEKESKLEKTLLETVSLVEQKVLVTQKHLLTMVIGTASACTLLALLWGLLMAKSISNPIVNLKSAVQRFGEGKVVEDVPRIHGDEVGELSRAFKEMMEDIKKTNRSLEDAKSYNWNIVQSMQDALFVVNGAGLVERVNPATLSLLDHEENSVIGKPLTDFLINGKTPGEKGLPLNPVINELVAGDIVENIECILITRKNHRIPVLLSGAIMHGNRAEVEGVVCVIHDMSEHVRAQELAEARDKAEAANKAKTTFLSRMSHELRTPMNAILGFAQLQEKKFTAATPDFSKRTNRQILSAGWHLLNLINDLLDLVQIEGNTLKLSLESCYLHKAIDESLHLVLAQNIKPGISVNYEETPMTVMADYTRLKQILINLLSNAIKYNREQGSVTIHTREITGDQIEISVSDTGVGIAPESHELIFEPFTRLRYAEENEIQGTGIGLSLTKFLVEQMNGSISIDSHVGHGTVFLIRLKRGEPIAGASKKKASANFPPPKTDMLTVLYIEDNPHSKELMEAITSSMSNIELLTSATAEEGIELARHYRPALIMLDINLPSMSGMSAVKILRRDAKLQHARIVALSADAMPAQIDDAIKAGFDQYITKPINIDQIIEIFADLDGPRPEPVA